MKKLAKSDPLSTILTRVLVIPFEMMILKALKSIWGNPNYRSSMKKYIKNKPVKWDFKFLHRCASEAGCLYQTDLYLDKK